MSEHEAFMRAILESPEDDTPRLIYSDWLEEHGGPEDKDKAELIRVQCESERLPEGDKRRVALEKRAKALVKANSKTWLADVKKAKLGGNWTFRRGFLHGCKIKATKFVKVAEKLFEMVPTLRAISCHEASNEVSDLAACPHLAKVQELNLHEMCVCGFCPIGRELAELFRSPHVANLTSLCVSSDRITSAGAEQIAASPYLGKLKELNLAGNTIGNKGLKALLGSPQLNSLETLDLSYNNLGPVVGKSLATLPVWPTLKHLNLYANQLGKAGGLALANAGNLDGLQTLDLRVNVACSIAATALQNKFGDRVKL